MDLFYIIAGLVLVVAGANFLTDGAAGIAARFGVSDFLIGVTVVAIGTSTPELVVSALSSIKGEDAIAVGNVVGSNLFNTLLIVGVTAVITPLALTRENIRQDIPFGILATVVLVLCAADPWLSDGSAPAISRTEGLMMLCFFGVFLAYSIYSGFSPRRCGPAGAGSAGLGGSFAGARENVRSSREAGITGFPPRGVNATPSQGGRAIQPSTPTGGENAGAAEETPHLTVPKEVIKIKPGHRMWVMIVMIVGGLAGLIYGGDLFVDGAVSLAHRLGISDTVIAVTIIAGGTSLPELAASLVAAIKHKPGIALGNILGSNVFNIFLVLGASASISPLSMGDITPADLLFVLFSAVLLLVCAFTFRKKEIDRPEGVILILLFIGYITWLLKR